MFSAPSITSVLPDNLILNQIELVLNIISVYNKFQTTYVCHYMGL